MLKAWNRGESDAAERLATALYPSLRRLAGARLSQWPHEVSLQATELAHEVYFKLLGQTQTTWRNRTQLYAVLARLMRRQLVDYVRHRSRQKRGGHLDAITLDASMLAIEGRAVEILALDAALAELASIDETAVRVVETLFFGGLTHDEAAEALGLGRATVGRKWRFARAWLKKRLAV
ncbi:MAG: ECF-type sigma factor [Acidobacteriota bacterium]